MPKQNFSNHARYIPLWHYVTPALIIAILAGSIVNLVKSERANLYSASLLVAIVLVLIIFYWYIRWFALRAQDRAIRAEESLRHFILTGKPLSRQLRTSQVIALRFASDEEFVDLALKATEQQMRSAEIKKAIKHWRSDHHRV